MSSTKILASILLALAVLITQVGNVAAAPQKQETPPPEITEISTDTDESGVTTVLVALLLEDQTTQTVRISLEYAIQLGLVNTDTQEPVLPEDVPDGTTIDPGQVIEEIPDGGPTEESVHPIAWLLGEFFHEDPSIIDGYHDDGFGFGVIAQALWVSQNLTETESEAGNASLAEEILQAKQDKNFEAFFEAHPEYLGDSPAPTNWGQFKKSLQEKKNNLGVVVSGQEEADSTIGPALTNQDHGNGNGKDKKEKKDKKNRP